MKTKDKGTKQDFDAVNSMRKIRDKISHEIADMNYEQLKKYFKNKGITKRSKK